MNALRINGYIDKDGLKISINKLKMFKNKRVEIIILPEDEKAHTTDKSNFFEAVGKVDIDINEINSLRELSRI
jgi:hypothetical protein